MLAYPSREVRMNQCQVCTAKCQLFLCSTHTTELRDMLTSLASGGTVTETVYGGRTASGGGWRVERDRRLAGLLHHLSTAALGQTRLSSGGARRGARRDTHLNGERTLASHIEQFPNETETDLEKARNQRERIALNHALAAGGINSRATRLLGDARELLVGAATRNGYAPLDMSDLAGTALWLAHSAADIAAHDDHAGQLHGSVNRLIGRIETAINRPVPPRFCGRCTTMVDREGREQRCELALYASREAIEVTCPGCDTVHNAEKLFNQQLVESEYLRFTREELIGNQRTNDGERYWTGLMGELGEFVHWRTFARWTAAGGALKPDGFRRPDGRIGTSRRSPECQPVYRLSKVRKARRVMGEQSGPRKAVMSR